MRASILAGLLAAGSAAHAFSDSSPFLLFSTAEFPAPSNADDQLQSSARVVAAARDVLARCPTSRYLLVSQPGAHAADLHDPAAGCEAHRLRRALAGAHVRGRFAVAETVETRTGGGAAAAANATTLADLASHIQTACGSDASVQELSLPALPAAPSCRDRAEAMGDNDYVLGNILDEELPRGDYTVVYFAGAQPAAEINKATVGEKAQQAPVMQKRSAADPVVVSRQHAPPARDNRGLFEKYQFFTPGIFMSLLTFFLLLTILYVGLSAVASLQVSYGAFDKEMGPAAQKKQQ